MLPRIPSWSERRQTGGRAVIPSPPIPRVSNVSNLPETVPASSSERRQVPRAGVDSGISVRPDERCRERGELPRSLINSCNGFEAAAVSDPPLRLPRTGDLVPSLIIPHGFHARLAAVDARDRPPPAPGGPPRARARDQDRPAVPRGWPQPSPCARRSRWPKRAPSQNARPALRTRQLGRRAAIERRQRRPGGQPQAHQRLSRQPRRRRLHAPPAPPPLVCSPSQGSSSGWFPMALPPQFSSYPLLPPSSSRPNVFLPTASASAGPARIAVVPIDPDVAADVTTILRKAYPDSLVVSRASLAEVEIDTAPIVVVCASAKLPFAWPGGGGPPRLRPSPAPRASPAGSWWLGMRSRRTPSTSFSRRRPAWGRWCVLSCRPPVDPPPWLASVVGCAAAARVPPSCLFHDPSTPCCCASPPHSRRSAYPSARRSSCTAWPPSSATCRRRPPTRSGAQQQPQPRPQPPTAAAAASPAAAARTRAPAPRPRRRAVVCSVGGVPLGSGTPGGGERRRQQRRRSRPGVAAAAAARARARQRRPPPDGLPLPGPDGGAGGGGGGGQVAPSCRERALNESANGPARAGVLAAGGRPRPAGPHTRRCCRQGEARLWRGGLLHPRRRLLAPFFLHHFFRLGRFTPAPPQLAWRLESIFFMCCIAAAVQTAHNARSLGAGTFNTFLPSFICAAAASSAFVIQCVHTVMMLQSSNFSTPALFSFRRSSKKCKSVAQQLVLRLSLLHRSRLSAR